MICKKGGDTFEGLKEFPPPPPPKIDGIVMVYLGCSV